jgi:hypothetical protein
MAGEVGHAVEAPERACLLVHQRHVIEECARVYVATVNQILRRRIDLAISRPSPCYCCSLGWQSIVWASFPQTKQLVSGKTFYT